MGPWLHTRPPGSSATEGHGVRRPMAWAPVSGRSAHRSPSTFRAPHCSSLPVELRENELTRVKNTLLAQDTVGLQ